jgi:hypothetical protein
MILNAAVIWFVLAPPPTSKKLAGLPLYNLIMSQVAIAKPAPFTMEWNTTKYEHNCTSTLLLVQYYSPMHPMLPSMPM